MFFFASLFQARAGSGVFGSRALLTDLPAQAASAEIRAKVTTAEKIREVADSANVRTGRVKLFMVTESPRFLAINPTTNRKNGRNDDDLHPSARNPDFHNKKIDTLKVL
jgi:hypothetical protein